MKKKMIAKKAPRKGAASKKPMRGFAGRMSTKSVSLGGGGGGGGAVKPPRP
jgi:hypothetical protein